ncbi:MAG: DUF362 domain-containing protein [Candidatus Sumerlaeia bacterium]|nr:DUF362 domain-containing protein [Candidatus Sumerlaeia bacterium]
MSERTRREFLRKAGMLAAGATVMPTLVSDASEASPDLAIVTGDSPKILAQKAVEALGGMKRFVARGDVVVIKPNIGWERGPELGANTNPEVVEALIEMAFSAGAKEIKIFDRTVQNPQKCYELSGIPAVAKKAGAKVLAQTELTPVDLPIKDGVYLKKSSVYKEALECDCYINVPVAKHHGRSMLTMAMKNHMGITADDRGKVWHAQLDQSLADFASAFKPKLNVLDAYRIMPRNGPRGGNAADVELAKKCIAGVNQVSVDAYGATLFGKKPEEIGHIALAAKMGLGEMDLSKLKIAEIKA